MAKPQTVQKLKHGKALCGKTFGGFVETFNWLVDFCTGLRGDGDDNGAGKIRLDRSLDGAPTIRNGAQPSSSSSVSGTAGVWEWVPSADDENTAGTLINGWVNLGGITRSFGSVTVPRRTGSIICVRFMGPAYTEAEGDVVASITNLNTIQYNNSLMYVVPLYVVDEDFNIVTDLRGAIQLNVFEPVD